MSEFSANKGLRRTAAICRDAPEYYQTGPRVAGCEFDDPLELTQPMTPCEQMSAAIRGAVLYCVNQKFATIEQRFHAAVSVATGARLDELCGITSRPFGQTDQQVRELALGVTRPPYPHDFRDMRPRGHLSAHEKGVQDLNLRDDE